MWNVGLCTGSLKVEVVTERRKDSVDVQSQPARLIPGNWQHFLRRHDNKIELISVWGTSAATVASGKEVISRRHTHGLCTQP